MVVMVVIVVGEARGMVKKTVVNEEFRNKLKYEQVAKLFQESAYG